MYNVVAIEEVDKRIVAWFAGGVDGVSGIVLQLP
jgi:hypothetical protein